MTCNYNAYDKEIIRLRNLVEMRERALKGINKENLNLKEIVENLNESNKNFMDASTKNLKNAYELKELYQNSEKENARLTSELNSPSLIKVKDQCQYCRNGHNDDIYGRKFPCNSCRRNGNAIEPELKDYFEELR